jgi:two-component system response regulator PilR (NtrC family)
MFCGSVALFWYSYREVSKLWLNAFGCIFDVFQVSWIVYLSGGPQSPFLLLYLLEGMVAAVILPRNLALGVGLIACLFYAYLAIGLIDRAISQPFIFTFLQEPQGGILVQLVGLLSSLVLATIGISYLSGTARYERERVEQTRADLESLGLRQRDIIDGVSDGIITARIDFVITSVNRGVEQLLGYGVEHLIGRSIREIFLPFISSASFVSPLSPSFVVPVEVVIPSKTGGERVLSISGRYLGERHESPLLYVIKDVTALRIVERKLAQQEEIARLLSAEEQSESSETLPNFIGESEAIRRVIFMVKKVSTSDATVLITGESGTGKEMVARGIHLLSSRSKGPFVAVNCGAIPDNLMESALFGHKKGAFTGAVVDSLGFFREAEGGTIFFDEVGELPLTMQTKLLRAIQERVVRPVGGEKDISVNVRILAATNRNLRELISEGLFREDLFYRLEVLHITLPPLRERDGDILLLVKSYIDSYRKSRDGCSPVISPAAMDILLHYDYPGNVRELENILERALVFGGEVILPEHFPASVTERYIKKGSTDENIDQLGGGSSQSSLATSSLASSTTVSEFPIKLETVLEDLERKYLMRAIQEGQGSRKHAAALLGLNPRSLRYRLQKFGIASQNLSD